MAIILLVCQFSHLLWGCSLRSVVNKQTLDCRIFRFRCECRPYFVHGCKFAFRMASCGFVTNTVIVVQMEFNGKQLHLVDIVSRFAFYSIKQHLNGPQVTLFGDA